MILFLDFDGVLHPTSADADGLFCCTPHLWSILQQHPELRVVFSTSWRERHTLDDLTNFATFGGGEDLASRFISVTPTLSERPEVLDYRHRRLECESWLADNSWEGPWLAIDDMIKLWGFGEDRRVYIVDYRHGLRDHDVAAVAARIRRLLRR